MIVMPGNNSNAHKLAEQFPGQLGLLMAPGGERDPRDLPYAYDNGMYSAWVKSGYHCEERFIQQDQWAGMHFQELIHKAHIAEHKPRWIVIPDVIGNAQQTIRDFHRWADKLDQDGFNGTLAMAVQDGMDPSDVPDGVVAFIGGTKEWKWRNVERFAAELPRVHVGRVNSYEKLWFAHEAGVESVDGTGWFRGDQRQLNRLLRYLSEAAAGNVSMPTRQLSLFV